MKRLVALLLVSVAALAFVASAAAHPLGNFTINHYSRVEPSGDRLYVLYVLDMAEIPTFQAKPEVDAKGEARYGAELAGSLASHVEATVGGRAVPLTVEKHVLAFPPGQAGLRTTRLEVLLASGPLSRGGPLVYHDGNYAGRIGWKEIVVQAGSGTKIAGSTAPSSSISHELLSYPKNLLQSPLDVTRATAQVTLGTGAGSPPTLIPRDILDQRVGVRAVADGGFAALIAQDHLSVGIILISLAVALFWGAAHALSPGHGKSIVAAYLVGQRGTPRHAVLLGAVVTITHTLGVFALGLVTLLLSQFIVPDTLYPWLNLIAGLMVVTIGLSVLRSRLVRRRKQKAQEHVHAHGHDHDHDGPHGHSHEVPDGLSARSLIAVGISGGMLPCPSALVVLLAAISLHRVAFGLVLIVAF
ncbi:MAG TPA: sulfite exporter TauE/SafE family protein, partial [Gaiellaceae bacterium]|nr:sulfite exporter TauE/SafE family protein [Gaiellaceae bacterium]